MDLSIKKAQRRISLPDLCAVIILAVCVFFLGTASLTEGCPWGDDFAAYILQGISIAEGNFDEQIKLNYILHPSFMPDEASDQTLVYVWGYSLILALVYKLVGFDRVTYASVMYYKLPSVIALALLAAVMYLFLRRRFGFRLSFFLSLFFVMCGEFFTFLDTLYSDLVFLFFAVLAIYLFELFLDASGRKRFVFSIVTGISLWAMYEIRLNGVAVLFSCILAHVLWLLKGKRYREFSGNRKAILAELMPYAVFLLLKLLSEAILAPATSNTSDLVGTNLGIIYGNVKHYFGMIKDWYSSMWSNIISSFISFGYMPRHNNTLYFLLTGLSWASLLLCLVGIVFDGLKRNFHYTAFLGIYLFVSSMLFYNQGLRYIYPMLPVLIMFTGYGFMRVVRLVSLPEKVKKAGGYVMSVLLVFLCFCLVYPRILQNGDVQRRESAAVQFNAYSPTAVEAYSFVKENVPEDSMVGFFKPRALYLNTGRMSMALSSLLDNKLEDMDYYLIYRNMIVDPKPTEDFVTVWENEDFIMMENQGR